MHWEMQGVLLEPHATFRQASPGLLGAKDARCRSAGVRQGAVVGCIQAMHVVHCLNDILMLTVQQERNEQPDGSSTRTDAAGKAKEDVDPPLRPCWGNCMAGLPCTARWPAEEAVTTPVHGADPD